MIADANPKRSAKAIKSSKTIGFRLDAEAFRALEGRAARLGLSPYELAKYYAVDMLQQDENKAGFTQGIGVCMEMLQRLQQNIASTAILIASERCTEEEARAWVEKNFV